MIRLLTEIRAAGHTRQAGEPASPADRDTALNGEIAARLRVAADHFQSHDSNPYRAASFRLAADSVAAQQRSLRAIYDERGRDGLHALPGIGPGIAAIIDDILRVRRGAREQAQRTRRAAQPPVQLLLEADRAFRALSHGSNGAAPGRRASRGQNAGRELRMQRDDWELKIFFSNSARAQELARTRDWVIVIASRGDGPDSKHTVVTETRGKLAGRRVVRGREAACRNYYSRITPAGAGPEL